MMAQFPIAWEVDDALRFVGKLTLRPDEFELNGTTTTTPRQHCVTVVLRESIQSAVIEQLGEWPTVEVSTGDAVYRIEILTGGRGAALVLVEALAIPAGRP
jgi:hypothetical protein